MALHWLHTWHPVKAEQVLLNGLLHVLVRLQTCTGCVGPCLPLPAVLVGHLG